MIFNGSWLAMESVLLFHLLRKQDQTNAIESMKFVVIFWFFF